MDCKLHVEILAYGGQSELGTYKKQEKGHCVGYGNDRK